MWKDLSGKRNSASAIEQGKTGKKNKEKFDYLLKGKECDQEGCKKSWSKKSWRTCLHFWKELIC